MLLLAASSAWSQNSITQGASKTYTIQMNVGNETGATYSWSVTPANGTSTNLGAITGNSVDIVWDGPLGDYTVEVQVTDGNGCLSEPISQGMTIVAPGDLVFASTFPSTETCSDLTGGVPGSNPPASESNFRITYAGQENLLSANITVQNPDGDYIELDGPVLADQNNPEITITNDAADKEIDFSLADSWENNTNANVVFELTLISAETADNLVINADPTADVERTVTVRAKPVIQFN
jgi:hypothetical protein